MFYICVLCLSIYLSLYLPIYLSISMFLYLYLIITVGGSGVKRLNKTESIKRDSKSSKLPSFSIHKHNTSMHIKNNNPKALTSQTHNKQTQTHLKHALHASKPTPRGSVPRGDSFLEPGRAKKTKAGGERVEVVSKESGVEVVI